MTGARDGATESALAPCPSTPNCVSSQAAKDSQHIAPLSTGGDPEAAWETLQRLLSEDSRIKLVDVSERHIRAEATTRLLRFTDDVEFLLDRDAAVIHMRSASRVGYSDLGKNRRRLEALRYAMRDAGVSSD